MQTEVMAVLPSVPPGVCLLLSVLACCPALLRAWNNPCPSVFAWGAVREKSISGWLVLRCITDVSQSPCTENKSLFDMLCFGRFPRRETDLP